MSASLRGLVAAAPAISSGQLSGAADDPLLRLFWYPLDAADDETELRHDLGAELVGAAQRLDMALDELQAAARVRDPWRSLERVEFRLENFAGRLGELREQLLGLLGEASRHPRGPSAAAGGSEPHDTSPLGALLAAPVEQILALIDEDLPVRDVRARRRFLHVSVGVAGALRDPRAAAARLRRRPDERRRVNRRLRHELGSVVALYAERVARIIELVVAVVDQTAGGSRWR